MHRRHFAGLTASTTCAIFAFAALVPVQVSSLRAQGWSAFIIGVVGALFFGVVLAVSPFVHLLVRRFGHRPLYWLSKALFSVGCLAVVSRRDVVTWAVWSAVSGIGAALLWPITESAFAELAPDEKKGALTGLYQTALGVAFAAGPFAAAMLEAQPLVVLCTAVSLGSTLGVWRFPFHALSVAEPLTEAGGRSALLMLLTACALIGGLFENGFNGVTVLLGESIGLSERPSLAVPGVIGVGSLVAQYPAGRVADRFGALTMLVVSAWAVVVATALTPLVFFEPTLVWPLAVVWGAAGGALYTLAVVAAAKHLESRHLTHATGLLVAAYTVGCAVAPTVAGAGFDWSPRFGLSTVFVPIAFAAAIAITRAFRGLDAPSLPAVPAATDVDAAFVVRADGRHRSAR